MVGDRISEGKVSRGGLQRAEEGKTGSDGINRIFGEGFTRKALRHGGWLRKKLL
jgi:hypothetical protein